jgi:neutral ceramidase
MIEDDRGMRAVIVTLDALALSQTAAENLRSALTQAIDLAPGAIFIAVSHTHAAPRGLQTWFPVGSADMLDQTLLALLRERLCEAARTALSRLAPARMVYNAGDIAGVSGDRNHPDRLVDSRLTALAFDSNTGERLAVIAHYACHPTVLGADNTHYSADFPGALRRHVQSAYPGAVCLYFNGAAGNISTRYTRRAQTFDEVERLGGSLGARVVKLLHHPIETDTETRLEGWGQTTVDLPIRSFEADMSALQTTTDARQAQVRAEGARLQAALARHYAGRSSIAAIISTLKLGQWRLIGVPGEAFDALAVAVRQADPFALIVGYANDYLGYFPTRDAIDDGTYEALSSPYDHRAHERLQEAILTGRIDG